MTAFNNASKNFQARHAEDWLMTYADMITLLLCFFIVFLIASISQNNERPQAAPEVVVPDQSAPPVLSIWRPDGYSTSARAYMNEARTFQGNLPFYDTGAVESDETPIVDTQNQPHPVETAQIAIAEQPAIPANAPSGDRIITYEHNNAAFFASGSAALSNEGKTILQGVAQNLMSEDFKDYTITVEGHTDNIPINTPAFPSNWELSTARATSVVKHLIDLGIPATRLRATGYADTFYKAPNLDKDGKPIPENQAKNRRVVIKLEKIDKN